MSDVILKKSNYNENDFLLTNLQQELIDTIKQISDNSSNPNAYSQESLGVIIFDNRYENTAARATAQAALDAFNSQNGDAIAAMETQVKDMLRAYNAARYTNDLTGDVRLMLDFDSVVYRYKNNSAASLDTFFTGGLDNTVEEGLKNVLQSYTDLTLKRKERETAVAMTHGRLAGIYKANGETDTRAYYTPGANNVTLDKNLVGMAFIPDFQYDANMGGEAFEFIAGNLLNGAFGELATWIPNELLNDIRIKLSSLMDMDYASRELFKKRFPEITEGLAAGSVTGFTAEFLDMINGMRQVSAEISDLCKNINMTGLTAANKDSLEMFSAGMGLLSTILLSTPAGFAMGVAVSSLFECVDRFREHCASINNGAAEINYYINTIMADGVRSSQELFPVKPATVDTVLNQGFNHIVADGVLWNKVHGTGESDTIIAGGGKSYYQNELYGEGGDDRLVGYINADLLNGGIGNDTYVYRAGFGNDTIVDEISMNQNMTINPHANAGSDTLILDGISRDQVRTSRDGNDLVMNFTTYPGSIRIKNHYENQRGRF